jgi:hypothetical protein
MILKKFGNIYISFPDERIMQEVLKQAGVKPKDLEDVDMTNMSKEEKRTDSV